MCDFSPCFFLVAAFQLDYVGKRRSSGSNAQQSLALDRESTLTQLLAEMDGFSPNDGVVVIATTNRGVSVCHIIPCDMKDV